MSSNEVKIKFDIQDISDQIQPLIDTLEECIRKFIQQNNKEVIELRHKLDQLNNSLNASQKQQLDKITDDYNKRISAIEQAYKEKLENNIDTFTYRIQTEIINSINNFVEEKMTQKIDNMASKIDEIRSLVNNLNCSYGPKSSSSAYSSGLKSSGYQYDSTYPRSTKNNK